MPRRDYQQLTQPTAHRGGVATAVLAVLLLAGCGKTATGISLSTPAPEAPGPASAAPVVTNSPVSPTAPSPSAATSTPPPTPRTSAPLQTDEQQVISAYTEYHKMFRALSLMPAASRPAALAKIAADPLYAAVLTELTARDKANRVVYGQAELHPRVAMLTPTYAAIEDCQDTSQTGLQDKTTGAKLTVGVPQFKRLTRMVHGADGAWRLSDVERSENGKC